MNKRAGNETFVRKRSNLRETRIPRQGGRAFCAKRVWEYHRRRHRHPPGDQQGHHLLSFRQQGRNLLRVPIPDPPKGVGRHKEHFGKRSFPTGAS